jgi:hypothetical protein
LNSIIKLKLFWVNRNFKYNCTLILSKLKDHVDFHFSYINPFKLHCIQHQDLITAIDRYGVLDYNTIRNGSKNEQRKLYIETPNSRDYAQIEVWETMIFENSQNRWNYLIFGCLIEIVNVKSNCKLRKWKRKNWINGTMEVSESESKSRRRRRTNRSCPYRNRRRNLNCYGGRRSYKWSRFCLRVWKRFVWMLATKEGNK